MSNGILLDTDLLIGVLRSRQDARNWLDQHPRSMCHISSISVFELWSGVRLARDPAREKLNVTHLLSSLVVIPFDSVAAERAADVRQHLEASGLSIGPYDTLLAGHALAHGWSIATHNTAEFKRVRSLKVIDWTKR